MDEQKPQKEIPQKIAEEVQLKEPDAPKEVSQKEPEAPKEVPKEITRGDSYFERMRKIADDFNKKRREAFTARWEKFGTGLLPEIDKLIDWQTHRGRKFAYLLIEELNEKPWHYHAGQAIVSSLRKEMKCVVTYSFHPTDPNQRRINLRWM
jgi:hypothetical protein